MTIVQNQSSKAAFSTDTDEELLFYTSLRGEDPENAQAAWAAFYQRHVAYLHGICRRRYGRILGDGVQDLVQDTFIKVFDRASTFTNDGIADPDRARRRVRAWIGRISQHLFLDRFRQQPPVEPVESPDDLPAPPALSPEPSREELLIGQALDELSDREQDVLQVTAEWYCEGQTQRVPNDIMEALALRWNTTAVNIRQIRHRATLKVKDYLCSHGIERLGEQP
jgi:RNA polymerase sigma factor (sigma-70 family)